VLKAENNEKYERANFYLQSDHRGSIWMDYRNALGRSASSLSKVTILYGHHLTTDECIFAQLENYLDVEYYKSHPVIEMNTIYDNYKWKVFACFITNVEPQDDNGHVFYYWDPAVTDDETLAFTGEILSRSWFRNLAVDLRATDKFLCLSTCTYMLTKPEYIESRCVVMARLVRDGESEQVDVSGAVPNEEHRMPQVWYTQQGIANPYRNVPVFNEY
jgi:sortase B